MSNSKKWIIVLLSLLVTVLCGVALAACNSNSVWRKPKHGLEGIYDTNNPNGDKPFYFQDGTNPDQFLDDESTYNLKVISKGGLPLENVKISVKKNGMEIASARSNANGVVRLAISPDNYEMEFEGLPAGYFADDDTVRRLDKVNKSLSIVFASEVIDQTVPASHVYAAGEVMYDFTFSDNVGNQVNLKDLLRTYDCVLLNFFYTTCGPCRQEFPAIQRTYESYRDKVFIVSLDPRDSVNEIAAFKSEQNLTFFMARDNQNLFNRFQTGAYPTNVFIDRYGVIAFLDMGGQPGETYWINLFDRLTAENYEQSSQLVNDSHNGNGGESAPAVKPDYEKLGNLPTDEELAAAAYADYDTMEEKPVFYRPSTSNGNTQNDVDNSWPYQKGTEDGVDYIYPTNVGVDNTYSIIYTDLTLQPDQILSLELKLNLEDEGDSITFLINQTINYDLQFMGTTDGEWREVVLYTATRPTAINLNILFMKDILGTPYNEFVGIRNIKISNIVEDPNKPMDVRTEMAQEQNDGSLVYKDYYLGDDGFYHMGNESTKASTDPIIYCSVMEETTWSLRRLRNYILEFEGSRYIKSVYLLSTYAFRSSDESDDGTIEYTYDPTRSIIEAQFLEDYNYNQNYNNDDIEISYYTPVTEDLQKALTGFTKAVDQSISAYEKGDDYQEDKVWLELCFYYRMLGQGHEGNEEHTCLATKFPESARGIGPSVAIELNPTDTTTTVEVKANEVLRTYLNPHGGFIYKFTAPQAGVYRFTYDNVNPRGGEPEVYAFKAKEDINKINAIVNYDLTTTHDAVIYLDDKTPVYLQLTVNLFAVSNVTYTLKIERYADEDWVREYVSDGIPTADGGSIFYQLNIGLDTPKSNDPYYYQDIDGEHGSKIYIDLISESRVYGQSLYAISKEGLMGQLGLTSVFEQYYHTATNGKDPQDKDYGLIEATKEVVDNIVRFTQAYDGSDYNSNKWATFAVYFHYFGSEEGWNEMPPFERHTTSSESTQNPQG